MKKLVLALSLLLLISTGISVVDSTPDETTSPENRDKTQSRELNNTSIIEDSYIIELEGEPKASTLEEKSKTQGLVTQTVDRRMNSRMTRMKAVREVSAEDSLLLQHLRNLR